MTWQPISTAPRDGRVILVAFSRRTHNPAPHHGAFRWVRPFWIGVGEQYEDTYATHWQPLPAPHPADPIGGIIGF